jgi:hypothetical protein
MKTLLVSFLANIINQMKKKYMKNFKISIITFFCFFSCSVNLSQTIEGQENGIVIDLDNAKINIEESFLYSSMYKCIKTTVLETNELCLIGTMNKMRVYNNYIIILDANVAKSVLIFDTNGRFIQKIGSIGQGPGEYIQPFDFTVDMEGNEIYILDSFLSKINKYNLTTGKFIYSINFDKNVRSFNIEYVGGLLFADAYFRNHSDDNYLIRIIQEPSGKIDGHFLNVKEYNKGISNISSINNNVFHLRENGNVAFIQPFMDKIINLSKDSVSTLFEIKSKDVLTSEIIKTAMEKNPSRYGLDLPQYNKYYQIIDFVEHNNILQFNYKKGNQLRMILFNKLTNEVSIIQKRWDDLFNVNKVNGMPAPKIGCYDSHGVYYYYDSHQIEMLKQLANNGALSPELDKLGDLKNLEEDANPVILYYEFKD